jgi:hypothetical protein
MLARLLKENAGLVPHDTTSAKVPLKETFDTKMLGRKRQAMKETYQKMKREHKLGRNIFAGKTGTAAEGNPTTAQAAIDAATEAWPLFSQLHTAFGPFQRLGDDTYVETCSPFKSANPADKMQAESAPATDPSSRAPRAAAKKARVAVSGAVSTVASEDGDPDSVIDDQQVSASHTASNNDAISPLYP